MKKKIVIKKLREDAKEVFEKAKDKFREIGKETSVIAKRGEKELAKITRLGKAEVGILSLNIRKNRLYYEMGKKAYDLYKRDKLSTASLKKLCSSIANIEKGLRTNKRSVAKYLKRK